MSALVVMMLLIFLLVIAFSLTIWAALTLKDRPLPAQLEQPSAPARKARRRLRRQKAIPTQEPLDLDPPPPLVTNDAVRGARASVRQHVDPRITPHAEEVVAEPPPEPTIGSPKPPNPPTTTAPTSEPPVEAPPPKERPKFLEDAFERFAKTVEEGDF